MALLPPYLKDIILGLTAVILFYYFLLRGSKSAKAKAAPEAGGAWPILGHLPLLAGRELPHITLAALADKYGPIFTVRIGIYSALVVSTWELAKEIFTTNDAAVWTRPKFTGGYEKAMKRTAKEFDSIIGEWLEDHRRKRDTGQVSNRDQDFMDVLLSVLDGIDLAGGTDTTTVTVTWGLALLLNHPIALRKAQEELDIQVGRERFVNESDIDKLVYLQAIVKETMRLYPAGPLSGPREFSEDCTIGGFHVPAGTRLMVNIYKIHRDPRVWSNPMQFEPERFLNTHKEIDVKGQNFELIPFGAGRRACPGINFGILMTQLALASFLQAFEMSTPSNTPVDMTETAGLTNSKATPLEVLVKPRLPACLYD
ncbi:hypothetical protein GH714_014188 [Hevea brasiliensis]|uniref:Cytochrome P450 n=1 Tax=Hevea brasiliensis TaxID=3981 RepID=A0A6A6NH61_HEVBR|nr:hypothetical protein GH714_014188 [Hevea brasiliensis]